MKKLQAIVDHLIVAKVAKPEQIEGVIESGNPQPSFEQSGPDLLLFRHAYVGRVVLKQLPHDLGHLLANVCAWMEENADDQTDEFLGFVGEPSDDLLGDLDLRLQFEEEAHYILKPEGYAGRDIVKWRGVEYVPGDQAADQAAFVDLVEGVTT